MRVLLPILLLLALAAGSLALAGEGDRASWEARLQKLEEAPSDELAVEATRLALELQAAGHEDLARRAYVKVLEADLDHPAARRALGFEQVDGEWLEGEDLYRAKGFVHHRGRWMTSQEFAEATRPDREAAAQKMGEARVLGLLGLIASEDPESVREARRRMATEDDRHKLAPLAKALRCKPTSLRVYAAEELGRLADPLAVPALLKRAVYDSEPEVRSAVARALREIGEPSTVHPLGRALDSKSAEVRVRAAEALASLGDELAIPYVVTKWEKRSGDFPRAYIAQVRQISYIQDFDVEVAQTSFIADPVVGVLQEGAVLALKVEATEQTFTSVERPAYVGALKKLSGEDYGNDLRAWARWWRDNEARLIEQRALRYERAAE